VIDLVVLTAIVVLLGILLLSNTAGSNASINILPDNEIIDSKDGVYNSSASATIAITMYAVADDGR